MHMKPEYKRIDKCIVVGLMLFTLAVVVLFLVYASTAIMPYDVKLDLSVLSDGNPARREKAVEKADYATVRITDIKGEDDMFTVYAEFPEYPDVSCILYLGTSDVLKLDVGDTVTVKGRVKYYDGISGRHNVFIGDAIRFLPFFRYARIVESPDGKR